MEKINIEKRYPEGEETGRSPAPYESFFQVLKEVFNFSSVSSAIDVGCADGHLIDFIKSGFKNVSVEGIEYFEYHKKYASKSIVDNIHFIDIRDPLPEGLEEKKFDIVICTEVGEHIEPEYTETLLKNLRSLTGKYLIMTWSRYGGSENPESDPHHQHLNPLPFDSFVDLMVGKGFTLNVPASNALGQASVKYSNFSYWWRESLTVWEVNRES
jgi:hypothetical protein